MSGLLDCLWNIASYEEALALCHESYANPIRLQSFIDGDFQATDGPCVDSYNPQTGRIFAKVSNSSASEVERATAAAAKAFPAWAKTTKSQRSAFLNRIADIIAAKRDVFAAWESIDQGKTFERAKVEVDRAEANFRYFAGYILHEESAARFTDAGHLTYEHHSAKGPFALISPWNMPLYLLTWKIAPCLAFGCTAVAKPSELTSITAFLLADVFRQVELPPGVCNIVFGAGDPTGSALVRSKLIKGVSFTGGTATGLRIRLNTVEDIGKHLSLELGGKNPSVVFADAGLDEEAIKIAATAAFENQGEICLCGSRIYVEKSIYEEFCQRFTKYVAETYRLGGRVGAVASLPHYHKVRSYLLSAKQENALFELGRVPEENPSAGYWITPTILTGLPPTSRIMQEEIFGPVVTIAPFSTEDEAITLANDNPNGLAAILLTKNGDRMRRVGEQIDAGLVWVNCWLVRQLATPFGGMKNSGTGREGGAYSREVFTNVRTLHIPM